MKKTKRSTSKYTIIMVAFFVPFLSPTTFAQIPSGVMLTATPSHLSFGGVITGTDSPTHIVTLTNATAQGAQIDSVNISGPFVIQSNTCGTFIAAGTTCQVSVSANIPLPANVVGQLTFKDGIYDHPQNVSITADGIGATTVLTGPDGLATFPGVSVHLEDIMTGTSLPSIQVTLLYQKLDDDQVEIGLIVVDPSGGYAPKMFVDGPFAVGTDPSITSLMNSLNNSVGGISTSIESLTQGMWQAVTQGASSVETSTANLSQTLATEISSDVNSAFATDTPPNSLGMCLLNGGPLSVLQSIYESVVEQNPAVCPAPIPVAAGYTTAKAESSVGSILNAEQSFNGSAGANNALITSTCTAATSSSASNAIMVGAPIVSAAQNDNCDLVIQRNVPPGGQTAPTASIQGTVTGASGTPIANANIAVDGPSAGSTTTGTDGSFQVESLIPGKYFIGVSAKGYAPITIQETTTASTTTTVPGAIQLLTYIVGTAPATELSLKAGSEEYFYVGSTAGGTSSCGCVGGVGQNPMTNISWSPDLSVNASASGNLSISIGRSTANEGSYDTSAGNHGIAGVGLSGYYVAGEYSNSTSNGTATTVPFAIGSGDIALIAVGGQGTGNIILSGIPSDKLTDPTYSEGGSNVIASEAFYLSTTLSAGEYFAKLSSTTYPTNASAAIGAVVYVLAPDQ